MGVEGKGGEGRGKRGKGKKEERGGRLLFQTYFRPWVALTVRILLYSVRSTRSGPFATRLSVCPSVCLSVTLMCCAQTTERIKLPFRVRVTPKHCDIIVLHRVLT